MSFIKLILVANIEFAAYFVISADGMSIKMGGVSIQSKGMIKLFHYVSCFITGNSITILSGFKKSFTAAPSFRNSGFEATSNSKSPSLLSSSFLMAS